ncbi:hypothetical protein MKX03_007447 [Papaver bracteatum]|nr:hypothetical protein MKX03_007447 [Papaver bracteatum]
MVRHKTLVPNGDDDEEFSEEEYNIHGRCTASNGGRSCGKNRCGSSRKQGGQYFYDEEFDVEDINDVEQQSHLPSVKDSKLWTVKWVIGHEREEAFCLMQKCYDLPGMHIISSISLDYLQKNAHVREACKGLKMLDTRKIVLVSIKEMTDVVSAKGKALDIVKDMWLQMKIGIYKGDIEKVASVPNMRQRVMVQLIPRVDLEVIADQLDGRKVSKKAILPSPRLVNSDEGSLTYQYTLGGNEALEFLSMWLLERSLKMVSYIKQCRINRLNIKIINHLLMSLKDCESGMSTSSESRRKCDYMKGDLVIVVKRDLINLWGWVEKVEDDNLHSKPNRKDLHTTVVGNAKYVCKYFKAGNHVKVNSNVLIIVCDATREDISVFADNIVDSSEVTSGATTRTGDYELHDLVMLGDMSFGVIIHVESESLQILKGDPNRPVVAVVKLCEFKYKIDDRTPMGHQAWNPYAI